MAAPNLTYRQLEALVTVAERGNISHAAVQLSISQPALSRMVSKIEAQFDVQVFERDGRGVTLTHAGGRLVDHAREALRHLDQLEGELRSLDGQMRGKICVAMPDTVGHSLFLPLIDRVGVNHPHVQLRVMGAHPNNVPLAMSAGDGDVGIVSSAHKQGRLHVEPLVVEQLHLVGPADWAAPDVVGVTEIEDLPLVLPGIQPGIRQIIDRAFASRGRLPNVVLELDSQDTLIEMIRYGRAWSIMSYAGVRRLVDRGELRACPITDPTLDRTLLTALPDNRPITSLMRAMLDEVKATVAEISNDARWVPVG